jgi:uncharacterized membrane protein
MTASNVILLSATTCLALMAGLFYSYSCSVVLGLKALPDTEYIAAMQSINRAIQNPVFFTGFFGALLLLPIASYMNYSQHPGIRFWLLLSATILYIAGAFCVTVFGNIPLNNALEKFDLLHSSKEMITSQRMNFEQKWNNLNIVRAISSTLSLILVIIACINAEDSHGHFRK